MKIAIAAFALVLALCFSPAFAADADVACAPQAIQDVDVRDIFIRWFPMLLLIGVWVFFMRSMNKGVVKVSDVHKKSLEWMDKTEKLLEELVLIQKQKK